VDAWCEACQRPGSLAAGAAARCAACGAPLATESLRSEELYGEIQHLAAVIEAWRGNPAPLGALLPDRPRLLTDLTPPEAGPLDDAATARALRALAAGAFADARGRLEAILERTRDVPRLWRALAVAYERLGEPGFAEWAWTQVLEREEAPVARLARGALRASRGEFVGAGADFAGAGGSFEARWNRAALALLAGLAESPGLPAAETLARARAEAGVPTPYWSNPTVGRLLWALLVERSGHSTPRSAAEAGGTRAAASCRDERVLRAAEHELEFDTFWDRALIVHGYAATGMEDDVARTGAALALELVQTLIGEPALRGAAAGSIAGAVAAAAQAVGAGDPGAALAALDPLLRREDLRRYRMPCGHCRQGSIGVDQVDDEAAG
jgi:hypothetical protein